MAKKNRFNFHKYEIIFVMDTELPIREIAVYLNTSYESIANLIWKLKKKGMMLKRKEEGGVMDKYDYIIDTIQNAAKIEPEDEVERVQIKWILDTLRKMKVKAFLKKEIN